MNLHSMASAYRHRVESPPKYRRSTMDIYHSLETGQHTHTTSALDRKWVHRSLGDLTSESDLQLSHSRLTSQFYQDLYRKYPRAFHRRREARDAGRKLFNPRPHVRFEDDIPDDMSLKSSRSERPITNWDREVSPYKNLRSRSRDCFTSAEPSETGSVLSVTERLHLNSQTLNKLLNEKSPLRKRFSEDHAGQSQYDSGTENENSGKDPLVSNRTRLRFRHRKVLQRKVDNKQNGAITDLGKLRKPASRSGEYLRRARTVSPTNSKHRHVDVETLIANADVEIDALLKKISMKMYSPDSPPDSAIDVDTPSVRSLISTGRGSNSDLPFSVSQEPVGSQICDGFAESIDNNTDHTEVSRATVSNISSEVKQGSKEDILDPLQDPDNILLLKEYGMDNDIQLEKDSDKERNVSDNQVISGPDISVEMDRRSDNVTQVVDINSRTTEDIKDSGKGQGLLQLYEEKSIFFEENKELLSHDSDLTNVANEYSETVVDGRVKESIMSQNDNELNVDMDSTVDSDMKGNIVQGGAAQSESEVQDLNLDKNYQADDEAEVNDDDLVTKIQTAMNRSKISLHRDSDVDSGIGQSGTDTRSPFPVAPPRGRSKQRGTVSKTQPVRADHSILPLRSEVDTCILNEVNLTHLSHDLSHDTHRRIGSLDETDDTDPRGESITVTVEEQKLTEKYRRQRSPSPYILKGSRHASPRFRAQSAPLYYSGKLDLHVVDISLSNESLSDIPSNASSTLNNVSVSGIDTFTSSKFMPNESVQINTSCQRNIQPSCTVQSSSSLQQHSVLTSNLTNVQSLPENGLTSSSPVEQRKSSSSTYSVTTVTSADSENTIHDTHINPPLNENIKHEGIHNINSLQSEKILNCDTDSMDIDFKGDSNKEELLLNENHSLINGNVEHVDSSEESDQITQKRNIESEQNISSKKHIDETESETDTVPNYGETIKLQTNRTSDNDEISPAVKHVEAQVLVETQVLNPKCNTISSDEDLNVYSAKKIDIVKPKLNTQRSVDSKDSFESVDLSDQELSHQGEHAKEVKEVKRIYKPSVNSPRINEKKANMRSIFKQRKGRYSPGIEQSMNPDNQTDVVLVGCDRINPEVMEKHDIAGEKIDANRLVASENKEDEGEVNVETNHFPTNSASHTTYSARPVMVHSVESNNVQNSSNHEKHMSRLKQNLHAELNLSKYKIKTNKKSDLEKENDQKVDKLSQSSGSRWSKDSQRSHDSARSCDSPVSQDSPRSYESPGGSHDSVGSFASARSKNSSASHGKSSEEPVPRSKSPAEHQIEVNKKNRSKSDDGEIVVEESNLQKSKDMSASRGSLMGGLKTATKGKFKAMRKAMSLERGIEQVGNDPQGQHIKQDGTKGSHSFFPKMKKAPSLKSITSFFGRKKKKGKYTAEEAEASASGTPASGSTNSSDSLTSNKRKQWASCHTLSSVGMPFDSHPVGRLLKMNPDGTQLIELTRPTNGNLGFFIAQGNPKFKQGVFVSRFSKEAPEKILTGLIGVGDEILEVNKHLVSGLSLEAVYKLMGASQTIMLKIFPLIARKDL